VRGITPAAKPDGRRLVKDDFVMTTTVLDQLSQNSTGSLTAGWEKTGYEEKREHACGGFPCGDEAKASAARRMR
jgi:hypothetical protein